MAVLAAKILGDFAIPKSPTHHGDLEKLERPSLSKHLFSIYYVAVDDPSSEEVIYIRKRLDNIIV